MNIGDVVMAKSGGPAMTIEKQEDGIVHCFWL